MLSSSQSGTHNPVPYLPGIITEKQLLNYPDLNDRKLSCT